MPLRHIAVQVHLQPFLTLALNGGMWSASCPDRFTPWEGPPGTHY